MEHDEEGCSLTSVGGGVILVMGERDEVGGVGPRFCATAGGMGCASLVQSGLVELLLGKSFCQHSAMRHLESQQFL